METFMTEYFDYSELDVNTPFLQILQHFFSNKRNPYKYALAKKHYEDCLKTTDAPTTKRLFKILTGTNLITTKMVMRYDDSTQGQRYKIKKSYLQLIERQNRNNERQLRQNERPQGRDKSFSILQSDSSDDDSTSTPNATDTSPTTNPTSEDNNANNTPSPITATNESIDSDITKQANNIVQNLDTALAGIDSDKSNQATTDIEAILTRLVKAETHSLLFNLKQKEAILDQRINAVNTLHESIRTIEEKLERTIDTVNAELQAVQTEIESKTK